MRVLLLLGAAACGAASLPPFTQPSNGAGADSDRALVVFVWPHSTCDPGGYYTLATDDGRFVGNVSAGTNLRASLPAGEYTIVGWDPPQEESNGGALEEAVPVLRAHLAAGRTYYVRMAFGEWGPRGPVDVYAVRTGRAICFRREGMSPTSAMVALTPDAREWSQLPEWRREHAWAAPDPAGQGWLDTHRDVLAAHVAVGTRRFALLREDARRMATIE
ncbi:MAG TPA: hypothetical protein VF765_14605 [Polyangiaceae bacterium]